MLNQEGMKLRSTNSIVHQKLKDFPQLVENVTLNLSTIRKNPTTGNFYQSVVANCVLDGKIVPIIFVGDGGYFPLEKDASGNLVKYTGALPTVTNVY